MRRVRKPTDPSQLNRSASSALDGLSANELNELSSKLAPALSRADEFETRWSVWSQNGDSVAATTAVFAIAACRELLGQIHAEWYALRRTMQTIDRIDLPLAAPRADGSPRKRESKAQALDRVVAEIGETDEETLASERRTMRQLGDEGLLERAARIRKCPEWSNEKGILQVGKKVQKKYTADRVVGVVQDEAGISVEPEQRLRG